MSSPPRRDDTSEGAVGAPVAPYVIVKFDTGNVSFEEIESLYNHPFGTGDPEHAASIVADLPRVLAWDQILDQFKGENSVSFRPVCNLSWAALEQLYERGRAFSERVMAEKRNLGLKPEDNSRDVLPVRGSGVPQREPELHAFFRFDFDNPGDGDRLMALVSVIRDLESVELVYVANDAAPPPSPPDFNVNLPQGYLENSPEGLGITTFLGAHGQADGRGTRIADVEQGWFVDHPDLPGLPQIDPTLLSGSNVASSALPEADEVGLHGMMVLGILVARHSNQKGIKGIAPGTTVRLASEKVVSSGVSTGNLAGAISDATAWLHEGDVLLIESQVEPPVVSVNGAEMANMRVPVEIRPDVFEAIYLATWGGVIVIEPTGNNPVTAGNPGGISLDEVSVELPDGTTSDLFAWDSGSILVAAGSNLDDAPNFNRLQTSNFSKFTNCFADGDRLWALDIPAGGMLPGSLAGLSDSELQALFEKVNSGGTSSAAAIIAGAALLLQSLARRKGRIIDPDTMRQLLSSKSLNTKPHPAGSTIGVMPDLVEIINNYPDLIAVSMPM